MYLKILNNIFKQNFKYIPLTLKEWTREINQIIIFLCGHLLVFVNLLNYLVKFQIIYKLDSILNVIIDKYTY